MLTNGTLARYIDEFSVTGLTSNPTIFDHAISNGGSYDDSILRKGGRGPVSDVWTRPEPRNRADGSFLQGCRHVVEVDEEGGKALLRDGVGHVAFDGVNGGSGRVETAAAMFGEVCGKGAAVVGGGGPGDQACVLQIAEDDVHGLAGDKGAAGELGVGQARLLVEEFEAGVLRHRQAVLAQGLVHGAAQCRGGAFEPVSHVLGDVPGGVGRVYGLPVFHVRILT